MKNDSFIFFCYNGFMKKIIITATAESIEQVEELLKANVDRIYVGEKNYGSNIKPHLDVRLFHVITAECPLTCCCCGSADQELHPRQTILEE